VNLIDRLIHIRGRKEDTARETAREMIGEREEKKKKRKKKTEKRKKKKENYLDTNATPVVSLAQCLHLRPEVSPLVVKIEELGDAQENLERALQQWWVLAHQIVQEIAVLLCEV
jgi:hypothetical protein